MFDYKVWHSLASAKQSSDICLLMMMKNHFSEEDLGESQHWVQVLDWSPCLLVPGTYYSFSPDLLNHKEVHFNDDDDAESD